MYTRFLKSRFNIRRIYSLGTGIGFDNPRTVCKSKFWLANIFFIFSATCSLQLIPDYRVTPEML